MNSKKIIGIASHLLFWFVPTYFMIHFRMVAFGNELSSAEAVMPFVANVLLNMLFVYFNILFLFPAYSRKNLSRIHYFLILIAIILLGAFMKVGVNHAFSFYFQGHAFNKISLGALFILELIIVLFFVIQSLLYCFVKEWIKNSIINRKLNEEKLLLELKYLKSQINPHFLFNTLNNLYSMALKNKDHDTAKGISKLSQIMRYMLTDANEKEILLDKEIEYLKSYIELQKLRFSEADDIQVSFEVTGNTAGLKIPPFMFIVFIENAFKYGIDYKKHSFIAIQLEIIEKTLRFNIRNSVHYHKEDQKQGIGLINVKERLNLLFKEKHHLEIIPGEEIYHVKLEINLES